MTSSTLKELRIKSKLTQREVADKIEVHHSMVSNWETGVRNPNAKNAVKLAKLYKVRIERILG